MASKPWLNQYPKEVNPEINPDAYISLLHFFEDCIKKYGDLVGFVNMGKTMTFKQLDEYSTQFAAYLQNHAKLKQGDRIAIQMPNLLQNPVVIFGAVKAGLIIVNTNPLYTEREMEHQFKDSGAKAIVILANFADKLEAIRKNTDIKHIVITEIGDMQGALKGAIVNFVVKYVKKMVPSYNIPEAVKFNDALKMGKASSWTRPELKGSDICFLQYTGGTTGVSKGAMLTHRNIVANMLQSYEWFKPVLKEREEIVITPLPLYHIFALTANLLVMMKYGAKNILITNPKDMKAFIKELKMYPFSLMTGVNTLFNGLLNQEAFKTIDFSHLKMTVGGGMAVQKPVAQKWEEVTKTKLAEGYGLTETSPVACVNPVDGRMRLGSIGLPIPSTELKVMNDDGQEVGIDEPGELWIKGPQVMAGYWQRPEETANVMVGEWFKSGDMAAIDKDGFFRIVDRKKEMVLVSGFNVYPNEVEEVLCMHPKILEAGVKGIPDDKTNEAVKAFIVKKDPSLTEEEVKEHCRKYLTSYKVPKHIVFRNELPKSNVGKILRRLME
ncbi:long-chain-fatty-acid--CoA ligase [Sporocytophaga myxococcoides]|uniref:Long-chain-fatty-acid--CoA ligase n=1 Tax=Sporocytophaga myxococcoides TaxID=153721 RepID=A0A098LGV1_9BACT|nr:AMP-binding protein [Sporocytophaga myxococcoides]GAL85707.1 long-chain-fatty-acid--CoA ligase [Sporocytophaga myxococcoides]